MNSSPNIFSFFSLQVKNNVVIFQKILQKFSFYLLSKLSELILNMFKLDIQPENLHCTHQQQHKQQLQSIKFLIPNLHRINFI